MRKTDRDRAVDRKQRGAGRHKWGERHSGSNGKKDVTKRHAV